MVSNQVTIVNDHPRSSGLGRYSEILYSSIRENASFPIICLSFSMGYNSKASEYPGKVLYSKFDKNISMMLPFIKEFPDLFHFIRSRFLQTFIKSRMTSALNINPNSSVIHYTNPGIYPFLIGSKTIVTIPDLLFLRKHSFRFLVGDLNNKRYIKYYLKAPYIVTFTRSVKKEVENLGFTGYVESILPAISDFIHKLPSTKEEIRLKMGLPLDKILILSVSTNRPGKNLKAVKDTMNVLDSRFKLVRVGVPIGDSITFQHVDDQTLNEIYNACDVLLFPSTEEGFGLPVTEAFKVGLPVVASDIEVMQEVCGNAAILVEPDKTKIALSVNEAISNSEVLSRKGLNRSLLFEQNRFANEMINLYKRVSDA